MLSWWFPLPAQGLPASAAKSRGSSFQSGLRSAMENPAPMQAALDVAGKFLYPWWAL